MPTARPRALAVHIILTGYGHWLPNDPRGSMSDEVTSPLLADLGDVHRGRRVIQPPQQEVRQLYKLASTRLLHPTIWFDESMRHAIGGAIGQFVEQRTYTCWACSILRNHLHIVIRTHRDRATTMTEVLIHATRRRLHEQGMIETSHPVWGMRPYRVFVISVDQLRRCIRYVEANPAKERLAVQQWSFVSPCTLMS